MKQFNIILVMILVLAIVERYFNYQYLTSQIAVQGGNMAKWHNYLLFGLSTVAITAFNKLLNIFSQLWITKTQKINFFKEFDGIIQTGKKAVCIKKFNCENTKLIALIEVLSSVISIVYTIIIMQVVKMTVPQLIGAGCILTAGIAFGVHRGKLQQKCDNNGAEIQTRQELLSNHFMISANVLENRLKEIESGFWKQIIMQISKNAIIALPEIIQVICFLALTWNIVECKIDEGTTYYSYGFVILTAYGYIVKLANDIGYIIEDISKIRGYNKDSSLKQLLKEEQQHRNLLKKETRKISISENGLIIHKGFTANVKHSDRPDSWYHIPTDLIVKKGEMIWLEGENETGKSRFNRLIKQLVPNAIMYDSNTAISNILAENFVSNNDIDFKLVRILAEGLGINGRIPESEENFCNTNFKEQLNSADLQRLIALQILYFAIKEYEETPEDTKVIILDEILANISEQNAKLVLDYMYKTLKSIGACTIIVSHTHKSILQKYANQTWRMKNEGNKINITSTNI